MKKILVLLCVAPNLFAAGFQVSEHSSTGLGRAFAGDAVIADDASVVATNAAAMSLFKKDTIAFGASYVKPDVTVEDKTNYQTKSNVAPAAVIPFMYYIHRINDQFALGFGEYTNFGVTTDYPTNTASGAGTTSLETMTLASNVSYRINSHFSVGGGANLVYGKAMLDRHLGSKAPLFNGKASDKLMKLEGDDIGFGYNLGTVYELNKNNRFGLSYHSKVELELSGTLTDHTGQITGSPMNEVDAQLNVNLPAFAEFSGFHQLTPKVATYYSVSWTDYSSFKELRATSSACTKPNACFVKKEDFKDNYRYSIGSTYSLSPTVDLTAGVAFDTAAGVATESIPDSDRIWYTLGGTYKASDHFSYNLGLAYVVGKDGNFTEDGNEFSASSQVVIASAQMNYIF